jgi:hypothetical protein
MLKLDNNWMVNCWPARRNQQSLFFCIKIYIFSDYLFLFFFQITTASPKSNELIYLLPFHSTESLVGLQFHCFNSTRSKLYFAYLLSSVIFWDMISEKGWFSKSDQVVIKIIRFWTLFIQRQLRLQTILFKDFRNIFFFSF